MITDFRRIIFAVITTIIFLVILRLFLKRKIRTSKFKKWCRLISDKFHDHQFLKVPEFNDNYQENQLFRRVSLYLNSLESLEHSDYTNLISGSKPTDILLSLNPNQNILDEFLGARLLWTYDVVPSDTAEKSFLLKIRKRDKRRVLRPYLQHIHTVSDDIDHRVRDIRLYTNSSSGWKTTPFSHPATFETVAMDPELKNKVKSDLETFQKSKQYYHRLGRVWRRSYLLYGPSGTGKSSFVAAMAKSLSYDVYDLDISKVSGDSDLKFLLLQTSPRSLILVEDFDKYVAGKNTSSPSSSAAVTISGVLNFMDGVVNSCCEERVMVFTMTTKEDIDPAILRPGRVDVHIYFPLCDFNNFKNLASNYLGVKEHKLFSQVEEMFNNGVTMSPAEIGELMMVNRNSPSRAIKSVINALQTTSYTNGVIESCKGTPKNGYRSARESVDEPFDSVAGIGCRDGVKEIRKLYGFLTRKSGRKSDSFDLGT
ncbi:AAA-ATPase At2g46620-like [Chenopodium quinoa]|uniref:AAA+ ATPase domain-containing protein n=1 Tax=Chenopodium quinoa TaxID=63459 RepID=A0A803M3C2_CHEQI|nr:AAA-ATPase At2g46620-like [Chenopodium quinoa]